MMPAFENADDLMVRRRIRCLMAIRGQSQRSLAKAMGVSQSTISTVLSGQRRLAYSTAVERFAVALGVDPQTIRTGHPWPE
jgi:plasmid maintenance system antidote protein VapI